MFTFIVLASIWSFSDAKLPTQPKDNFRKQVKVCNQEMNHIKKAFKKLPEVNFTGEDISFESNEKEALSFLKNLHIDKMFASPRTLNDYIIRNCNLTTLNSDLRLCSTFPDSFDFFRALIYGIRDYSWSKETKELAKNHIISFIKKSLESTNDAVVQIAGLKILQEAVSKSVIQAISKQEATRLIKNSEELQAQFLKKLEQDKPKPRSDCESYKTFILGKKKLSKKIFLVAEEVISKLDS